MKFEPNKRYTTIAIYVFLVIAVSAVFYLGVTNFAALASAFWGLFDTLRPLVFAVVVAYLLNPVLRVFDDRLLPWLSKGKLKPKPRRAIALLLTHILTFLLILAFAFMIVPQLWQSLASLVERVPAFVTEAGAFITDTVENLSQGATDGSFFGDATKTLLDNFASALEEFYAYGIELIPGVLSAGVNFTMSVIYWLIGFLLSVYLLYDRERMFAYAKKVSHAIFPDKTAALLYDITLDAHRVFSGFIIGRIIDSAIIGVLCFIGMSILQMPYVMLISVVVGVTNVIPYVGPFIGAIPSAIIILIESPITCLWFVVFILILQQFDGNILGPKIMGNALGVSPLWIIIGLLLFSAMFGAIGMFVGVPLIVVFTNLVNRLFDYLLQRKNKSVEVEAYASDKNPPL